jgi:hypothetical protein
MTSSELRLGGDAVCYVEIILNRVSTLWGPLLSLGFPNPLQGMNQWLNRSQLYNVFSWESQGREESISCPSPRLSDKVASVFGSEYLDFVSARYNLNEFFH